MSVDKLLARSTPLSVNSCPIQELTDIPGVGWDIARSLMGIREEGQITLPVLEAVTRRVFHQEYLEKLDFAPAGLTSAIRGSARPKTPSERRTDQWAEDLKSEHPGTSGLPDTPHMPRRLPTPGPDFQKIEDELNAMLGEITMRGGAKKKTSKESKGKLSFSADPDEDLQRRMDRLRPPRVKQEKVRVPQLAHDLHQPESSSEEEDVDTVRPLYRPSLYTRSEVSALKSLPKTLIYDGKGNWQAFQLKFGRFAGASAWTEQQCRDCLLHCLTDKALSYAAMILRRDPDLSYRKMMRKLERRFGAEELPAAVQAKFSQAMQSKGETMEEWADRVQAMATEAFRELPERYSNQQAIARFCQGLLDADAGHNAFMRSFNTIEEAMNEVRLFQHSKQAMAHKQKRQPAASTAATDYDSVQVSAVQEQNKSNVQQILEQLQLELKEVKEKLSKSRTVGRGRGARRRNIGKCWICDKDGHFHRDCPLRKDLNKEGSAVGAKARPDNQ